MVVELAFVPVVDVLCTGLLSFVTRALEMKKPCKWVFMGCLRGRLGGRKVGEG